MTHSSPSRTARVRMPATSLPASGSVTAMEVTTSPRMAGREIPLLQLVRAVAGQGGRRHRHLHGHGHGDAAAADASHLLAGDEGVGVVRPHAAVGLVVLEAEAARRRPAWGRARGRGRCGPPPTRRRGARSPARRGPGASCGTAGARRSRSPANDTTGHFSAPRRAPPTLRTRDGRVGRRAAQRRHPHPDAGLARTTATPSRRACSSSWTRRCVTRRATRTCGPSCSRASGTVFCSGADLSERGAAAPNRMPDILTSIVESPVPVIARVNGHARAGGLGLIAAADMAVARRRRARSPSPRSGSAWRRP